MLESVRTFIEPRLAALQAQPAASDLDEPHLAVWQAARHLFPRHADATQTDHCCLVVSWRVRDPLRGCTHFAAPVVIRMRPGLLLALWCSGAEDRDTIAQLQVEAIGEALAGYDPHSRVPTCDVIELGDG